MKLKMILVTLAVTLLVTGCGSTKPGNETAQAATPEDAISRMFAALKTADAPSFNALVQYQRLKENGVIIETERFFGDSLDSEDQTYILAVFEELSYTILSSTNQTDEQKSFILEITNKDLSQIDALDYADADNYLLAQANAIKAIKETVTKTIEVNVVYAETGWQVMIDDELRSALWGNKQGTLDALSNLLPRWKG